jgi:predicted nucleic acid-binding protein
MLDKTCRIYLDVCCLSRPFDDQSQLRVHLETEAVLAILRRCETKQWQLVNSTVLEAEVAQISNPEKLQQVRIALNLARIKVLSSAAVQARASELIDVGFTIYDAAHIASAERGNADVFLSTDDRLVKRAKRLVNAIRVSVDNPLNWLTAITQTENSP